MRLAETRRIFCLIDLVIKFFFGLLYNLQNQSIRQTPIFPKDIDIKLKIWYNLCRFLNKGYSNVQEII